MHIEMKQRVLWVQSLGKDGLLYSVKHKNGIYALAVLQKLYIGYLIFELL